MKLSVCSDAASRRRSSGAAARSTTPLNRCVLWRIHVSSSSRSRSSGWQRRTLDSLRWQLIAYSLQVCRIWIAEPVASCIPVPTYYSVAALTSGYFKFITAAVRAKYQTGGLSPSTARCKFTPKFKANVMCRSNIIVSQCYWVFTNKKSRRINLCTLKAACNREQKPVSIFWMHLHSSQLLPDYQLQQLHVVFAIYTIVIHTADDKKLYTHWPVVLVLWWISFHMTALSWPVVTDRPTVKTSLASNARLSSWHTSWPSLLFGRYACRRVPEYGIPGLGWVCCVGHKNVYNGQQ